MPNSPSFLKKGDLVIVVSPSGKVHREPVEQACDYLSKIGLQVIIAEHAFDQYFKFAATHEHRFQDLQWALDHSQAKAIFCSRGGFGISYIVDQLNWDIFRENPKWIIGFSDITVLHHAAFLKGYRSIHGPVLQSLVRHHKLDAKALSDFLFHSEWPNIDQINCLKGGAISGELVGGNLSMIINQIGTASQLDFTGKILFIEEIGEYLYHIDRMILQLKRANILSGLKGIVLGDFSETKESKDVYGKSIQELFLYHTMDMNISIFDKAPIGHSENNRPVIHGALIEIIQSNSGFELKYISED